MKIINFSCNTALDQL